MFSTDWSSFNGTGRGTAVCALILVMILVGLPSGEARGQIGFGSGGSLPVSVGYSSTSAGDINRDGEPDLVVIGRTNSGDSETKVFENDDSGFTEIGATFPGVDFGSTALRDIDGDGDRDLLVTGSGSTGPKAVIYENDGSGGFPDDFENDLTGVSMSSSAVGDLNGNGHPDLLITGDDGEGPTTTVYFNDGDGNFTAAAAGLEGVQSGYSLIKDFDGDGDADILVGGDVGTEAKTFLYENDGSGNFSKSDAGIEGVYGTATAADFDGDGDIDILISGDEIQDRFDSLPSTIVYENDGSGILGTAFSTVDAGLKDLVDPVSAAADFNGDGSMDLVISGVVPNEGRQAKVYANDGSGAIGSAFSSVATGLSGDGLSGGSITVEDMNGDARKDIILTGANDDLLFKSRLYLNTSNRSPDVSDDAYSLQEDDQLTVSAPGVLANDSDPDGNEITASKVSGPSNGTLNLNADGSFSYVPDADFSGTDSFTYEAGDGVAYSEATVVLTVNPVNDPPSILRNEGLTVFEGEAKTITSSELGASDPDDDASALTFSVTNGPSQGNLLVRGTASSSFTQADLKNGAVEYDHTSGTTDDDSFTFSLSDAEGEGPTGETFSISVSANNAPSAPTGLTASGEDQQVNLTWDSNSEGDMGGGGYEVHRATTSGFTPGSGTLVATVSHTGGGESYIDDGSGNLSAPSNGTSYYYRVLAVDEKGSKSSSSSEVEATPTPESTGPPLADAPWPTFGQNTRNTGRSPNAGPEFQTKEWVFETNGRIESSPTIGPDGTVYVGSNDNNVYAIGPDGKEKWRFETGDKVETSPAISGDGTVYVGSNDGNVYAINQDGTEKWRFETGSLVQSPPKVGADGTIYVGSNDGNVYAINQDGTKKWRFKTGAVYASPAIGPDGTVYVGSSDGNVYAISQDGTEKWRFETGGVIGYAPTLGPDGTVYVGSGDGNVYAINQDGTEKWRYGEGGGSVFSSQAIGKDGTVYAVPTDGNVYAISSDGEEKWRFETGDKNEASSSPVVGGNGTIYVGSQDKSSIGFGGSVAYAIEPGGVQRWRFSPDLSQISNVRSAPAIGGDGTVYVGSTDGNVYAIGKADPPALSLGSADGAISENNSPPNVLTEITVDDQTTGKSTLSLSGPDAGAFNINGSNELEFTTTADYESKRSYSVTVELNSSTVGDNPSDSQNFSLTITDASESPSVTGLQPESGPAGTLVRIYGSGFRASTLDQVNIGGKRALVERVGDGMIQARVPSGTGGGPQDVGLSVGDASTESPEPFTVVNGGGEAFTNIRAGLDAVNNSGSASWGDFDNDGDPDLVVTGSETATIYRNQGGGNFEPIGAGLTGVEFSASSWGDIDGDGDLDLVVAGQSTESGFSVKKTTVYRNEGNGNFEPVGAELPGISSGDVDWGDYNGDGALDLVVTGSGTTAIYRNEGDGSFTKVEAGLTGVKFGSSSSWGDYDGDGDLDLVVTGFDGSNQTATIYRNEGGGTFDEINAGLTGVSVGSSDWGDYDGDGDLDLVLTGRTDSPTATIYRNDGKGTFEKVGARLKGVEGGSANWGDFDGDGDLDLVLTGKNGQFGTATVYRNDGDDGFNAIGAKLIGGAVSSDWGDIDSDGDLDLIIAGAGAKIYRNGGDDLPANRRASSPLQVTRIAPTSGAPGTRLRISGSGFGSSASSVAVTVGGEEAPIDSVGSGIVYARVPAASPKGPQSVRVSVGGNTAAYGSAFGVLTGGSSTFSERDVPFEDMGDSALEWGDFDKDGDLDLMGSGTIYENIDDGGFEKVHTGASGPADWGDFDGDGDLDLVVSSSYRTVVYRNQGSGRFEEVDIKTGLAYMKSENGSVNWGDVDRDGDLDVVVTGEGRTGDPITRVYRNEGRGVFKEVGAGLTTVSDGATAWGDFDGDGDLDLAVTGVKTVERSFGSIERPSTTIYRNGTKRSFEVVGADVPNVENGAVSWGDFDEDGDLDLAIIGRNESREPITKIYRHKGDGTFEAIGTNLTGVERGDVEWGDFNSDGALDLIVMGENGAGDHVAMVYRNEGDGTFERVEAGMMGEAPGALNWGDVDGDGDLDVAVSGEEVTIYQNSRLPDSPTNLAAERGEQAVTLTWKSNSEDRMSGGTYEVHRSTTNGFTPENETLVATVGHTGGGERYTDDGSGNLAAPVDGVTYYYKVVAVDEAGNESKQAAAVRVYLHPPSLVSDVGRSFGDASGPGDYRMVALPGAPDTSLGRAVRGEAGIAWQAYRDDGTGFVRYNGTDAFSFETGRGFWLTSRQDWTVEDRFASAPLRDSTTTIPLNDGWTIVANPFGAAVPYSALQAANEGDLSGLWPFEGAFSDTSGTFASATGGRAYYLYSTEARDSLRIPHPALLDDPATSTAKATGAPQRLALSAVPEAADGAASTVRVGLARAEEPADPLLAPPGGLEAVSLRIEPPAASSKSTAQAETRTPAPRPAPIGARLSETDAATARSAAKAGDSSRTAAAPLRMTDRRVPDGGGTTVTLRLTNRTDRPVRLRADRLDAVTAQAVALLHPATGRTQDLRVDPTMQLDPTGTTRLKVALGTEAYVEEKRQSVLPDEVTLAAYPNPMRRQGTVAYGLPEAQAVTLRVYDVLGRRVSTLATGRKRAGRHTVSFDAAGLSSGIYFARLTTGGDTWTEKIVIVR